MRCMGHARAGQRVVERRRRHSATPRSPSPSALGTWLAFPLLWLALPCRAQVQLAALDQCGGTLCPGPFAALCSDAPWASAACSPEGSACERVNASVWQVRQAAGRMVAGLCVGSAARTGGAGAGGGRGRGARRPPRHALTWRIAPFSCVQCSQPPPLTFDNAPPCPPGLDIIGGTRVGGWVRPLRLRWGHAPSCQQRGGRAGGAAPSSPPPFRLSSKRKPYLILYRLPMVSAAPASQGG
jgi:hypothetical protein